MEDQERQDLPEEPNNESKGKVVSYEELIARVVRESGVSKDNAKIIVDAAGLTIGQSLANGEPVKLPFWGTITPETIKKDENGDVDKVISRVERPKNLTVKTGKINKKDLPEDPEHN